MKIQLDFKLGENKGRKSTIWASRRRKFAFVRYPGALLYHQSHRADGHDPETGREVCDCGWRGWVCKSVAEQWFFGG